MGSPTRYGVAWLESAAERIPKETMERIPQGGIPVENLAEAVKDTRFEGAAKAASWVFAETGNFFLDACYEDGNYDGFCDPWEDEIIAEGTEEWRKASALMDSGVQAGRLAGGGAPRPFCRDAGIRPGAAAR